MSTPAAEKTRALTAYRVLKFPAPPLSNTGSAGTTQGIKDVGGTNAPNANAAIRTIAEKAGEGTYVAIPESSWKPVKVSVSQTVVVKIADA